MRIFIGISGETITTREIPPDTYGTGLYRLHDLERGDWLRVEGGLPPDPEVRSIVVSDAGPARRILIATQYGVYASHDTGDTWRLLGAPRPGHAVWSLAVHPDDPDTLLAGYEPAAVHRSHDGGETWDEARFDVDYTPGTESEARRVIGLAFDPMNPDDVYGAIEVGGLIASRDGGRSFTSTPLFDPDFSDGHAIAVGSAGVLACTRVGVLCSEDRGRSWSEVLGEHMTVSGVTDRELAAVVEEVSERLFAGNIVVVDVEPDARGSLRFALMARRSGRVDYGDEFDPLGVGARRDAEGRFRAGACVHAVVAVLDALFRARPDAVVETHFATFAGTLPDELSHGLRWSQCDCNQPGSNTGHAALRDVDEFFPTQPYLRCISVADGGDDVCVGAGCGYMSRLGTLYRSRDGGESFRPIALPSDIESGIFGVARRPDAPHEIICAARDGQIFWSMDDGRTWSSRRTPDGADPVYALALY